MQGSKVRHPAPIEAQLRAPGDGAEPRTAGLGAALRPEPLSSASLQVRFALPASGLGSGTACVPDKRCPGRGSSPSQHGFPQPVFLVGTHLPARRRSALHLRPPGLRAQTGAGSAGSLREHAVLLAALLPQEPGRFGFPHGDTQYSLFAPGRGRCALLPPPSRSSPPPSPRQRILSRLCRSACPSSAAGRVLRGRQKGK